MKSFLKTASRAAAALFAVALVTMGVASPAFADGATGPITTGTVTNTTQNKSYNNLTVAIKEADDNDTIELGPGNYTTYVENQGKLADGKSLTFVGSGKDTIWGIGAKFPKPENFGTEYNGDYSFDGSKTITFKNMTLHSDKADYLGFIRIDNTVVDNCIVEGKTFYWGYKTAVFKNTTFNAPDGDYALWTYSSPVMTFDGCTFNATGKVINVYTDFGAGKNDIIVNVNSCAFNSTKAAPGAKKHKQALKINDSNMKGYKYILNITGINTGSTTVTAERDDITCSQLFGFGGETANNSGRTDVTIDGVKVWSEGKMVTHDYTDGQHEDNFVDQNNYVWKKEDDGWYCTGHAKCGYCGWPIEETVKATFVDKTDCTEKGERTYTATFTHECFEPQTKTEALNPIGHDWGEPEYSWAKQDGEWFCTAKRVCKRDASHVEEETVKASVETTPATCTKAGKSVYTAAFENEAFEAQKRTVALGVLGHDWGAPEYSWNEKSGNWYCTAKRVCKRDASHVDEQTVKATVKTTPATCLEEGESVYTAKFDGDAFETQTKAEKIAALGHDWAEPEYSWAKQDGEWFCTAKRVCKRDASHVEEETVKAAYKVTTPATTEKEGEGTYTATFENEAFETQTKTESIDKLPVKPQKPAKPKDDKPSKSDKTNKQTLPGTGDSTANVIMAMLSMTAICFAGSAIASKMRK